MKNHPKLLQILLATALMAHSQAETEFDAQATTETPASPRILGEIPDGTPPPPTPPEPVYELAVRDILDTATHKLDGRTITIRQIKPIAIPPQPAPVESPAAETTTESIQAIAVRQEEYSRSGLLSLSATVYRSDNSAPRTLVRIWPGGGKEEIVFWSPADFALIAGGINSFVDAAGDTHHLLMAVGDGDAESFAALRASLKTEYDLPDIPDFPVGKAIFRIIGEQPADEELVPIRSLHDLYNSEYARLKTALEGRERARTEREEFLKANPPQPEDITLNFWRTETPATNGKEEPK